MPDLIKRLGPWFRLASEYTAAHMATRLLAALSGLILVRAFPVNEYGFYTLVLAAFTFICTFSDLGATETLSFFRWRAGKRNRPWMQYFHAVVRFRKTVFIFGFLVAAIYTFTTGRHIDTAMHILLPSIALMGLGAWFAIQSGINSYVLKLEQRFRAAYTVELSNEGIKLLSASLILVLGLTTALAGLVSVAIGALVAAVVSLILLDQAGKEHVRIVKHRASRNSRILLGQIMPILPGLIHFALQGPLVAWLAAYYGSVVNLAEVGALSRLGVLIGVIAGFTSTVFVPRLVAISDEAIFLRYYLLWWLVIIALGSVIMLAVTIFPEALLFLLGDAYSGLHTELIVMAATAVVWTWNGYVFGVNRARGWVKNQAYIVLVLIVGQLTMFVYLDFSTTLGVLLFGLGTGFIWLFYQLLLNVVGIFWSMRHAARYT